MTSLSNYFQKEKEKDPDIEALYFECMYTKHKIQKRKIWNDGFLVVHGNVKRMEVRTELPPLGKVIETYRFNLTEWENDESIIPLERHLIEIMGIINASNNEQSSQQSLTSKTPEPLYNGKSNIPQRRRIGGLSSRISKSTHSTSSILKSNENKNRNVPIETTLFECTYQSRGILSRKQQWMDGYLLFHVDKQKIELRTAIDREGKCLEMCQVHIQRWKNSLNTILSLNRYDVEIGKILTLSTSQHINESNKSRSSSNYNPYSNPNHQAFLSNFQSNQDDTTLSITSSPSVIEIQSTPEESSKKRIDIEISSPHLIHQASSYPSIRRASPRTGWFIHTLLTFLILFISLDLF